MKKIITWFFISFLLTACAGANPHPVAQYQHMDKHMSCEDIILEMSDNQTKILNLIPKQNKTGKNVALGVAGYFLIVPWFFMDFSDAEKIEIQAYEQRDNWLRVLANKKHCRNIPGEIKFADR